MNPVSVQPPHPAGTADFTARHHRASADVGNPNRPGRALVPLSAASPRRPPLVILHRPSAPFLAQLIAAKARLPQARERRRAEPVEAIAAYLAVAAATATPPA